MKNLIITLTLLLGVMSYGQQRAVVTEYTSSSSGEKIFLHKNAATSPSRRCQFGDIPRFEYTVQYDMYSHRLQGNDVLIIDPDITDGDTSNRVIYRVVSDADVTAFRNDITEDRDPHTDPNRYRTRNGGLSFNTPCGEISAQAFLEGQLDHDASRSTTGAHYFGTIADTYITVQPGGFMVEVAFGNNIEFFPFTNVVDAYAKLQELFALTSFERELIADEFVPSPDSAYDWEKRCTTGITIRIELTGNGTYRVQNNGTGTYNQTIEDVRRTLVEFCN